MTTYKTELQTAFLRFQYIRTRLQEANNGRMSPDSEQMRRELSLLSRHELQALARQEGVRANGSSADIVHALLAAAADASHAAAWRQGSKPHQPHAAGASSSSSSGAGDVACRGEDQSLGVAGTAAAATPRHGQHQPSLQSAHSSGQLTRSSAVTDAADASRRQQQQHQQQHQHQRLQLKLQQLRMSPPRGITGRGLLPARQLTEPTAAEVHAAAGPRAVAASPWHVAVQQQQQQPAGLPVDALPQQQAGPQDRDQLRRDRVAAAAAANRAAQARAADDTQHQQQQRAAADHLPGSMVLHTPRRVRVPGGSAAVAANLPTTPAGPAAAGDGGGGAVTPPGQRSSAFGGGGGGLGAAATPRAAASADGLLSPRPMGTARRVALAHARTGGAAAAAGACAPPPGVPAAAAAPSGPPATPLQQPARRRVLADAEQLPDASVRQLEQQVERCVRIANPGAAAGVLQGLEPAKAWLCTNVVEPLQRARALAGSSSSSSRVGSASSTSSSADLCTAAGFCHALLLLYGPRGSGKTELVHGLAAALGGDLLYLPAGELLRDTQHDGQALLRALFRVAQRIAPVVVCFDDAHLSFPLRLSNPSHPGHKMLVELLVQLQQLEDASAQLQARLAQRGSSSGSSSSSTAAAAAPPSARKRPAWGTGAAAPPAAATPQRQPQQPKQQPSSSTPCGPVVVVFATRQPEALEPRLLGMLPVRLLLDLPCADSREELLAGWLVDQEAALGVQEVEGLARDTEGFSCSDLLQLCHEAALRPVRERARRALTVEDFAAALGRVAASVTPQRRAQLRAWPGC